ncbi:MAG TPA: hypothetical protein VNE58_11120 [Casimicrobiaceae bacterium]|nr:hypothetical protein [Casimicrobiaceae bacterium]
MTPLDHHPSGRHFLQIRGPTNVPDRVLRAVDRPAIGSAPARRRRCRDGLLERSAERGFARTRSMSDPQFEGVDQ